MESAWRQQFPRIQERAPAPESGRVHYVVLTLNSSVRRAWVRDLQRTLPSLEVFQAVNGFDRHVTVQALAASGLKYHINTYCGFSRFGTYGSLANYLTKYFALASQVKRRIPYMAMLEDDMRILPAFPAFVEGQVDRYLGSKAPGKNATKPELLVLGAWGEGYVTSLESAQRMLAALRWQGVPLNVDIMFNDGHVGRAQHVRDTPWLHRVKPNFGDIQSTAHIRQNDLPAQLLAQPPRGCTAAGADACQAWLRAVRERYCRGKAREGAAAG